MVLCANQSKCRTLASLQLLSSWILGCSTVGKAKSYLKNLIKSSSTGKKKLTDELLAISIALVSTSERNLAPTDIAGLKLFYVVKVDGVLT